jgi:glycogen synthase
MMLHWLQGGMIYSNAVTTVSPTFANTAITMQAQCTDSNCNALTLQGGMIYSNAVTTVSPTYANEVLNGGQAGWLRSTFLRPEVKSKVG